MTTSLSDLQLQSTRITGTVGVTKVVSNEIWDDRRLVILIMGPTGAGKSSFMEALRGPNSSVMNLSSGQLDGFTQEVSGYKVQGLIANFYPQSGVTSTLYLVDTPGFADDKISALEIVSKVQAYLDSSRVGFRNITHMMYFTPITSTRLPGSQRQVIKAFKALSGVQSAGGLTIVTTMWDTVWNEQARKHTEANFQQLSNEIWKNFISKGATITKFYNTQASAAQILDLVAQRIRDDAFNIEDAIANNTNLSKTTFGMEMYTDLVDRIYCLQMRKNILLSDLSDPSVAGNQEVHDVLNEELRQLHSILTKFEQQLTAFAPDLAQIHQPALVVESEKKGPVARVKQSAKRLVERLARRDLQS